MNTTRTCPQCQQTLPADAPEGLCPACVMQNLAATQPGDRTEVLPPGSTPVQRVDIADPAEIAKRLPQFEIIELLGRGGMGVVYKARQPQLDRMVALKILPPEDSHSADFIERFRREARSLAKLNHSNIVTVHDFGESDGLYYFIMEFVDGANLRQLMQAKKLTADEALSVVPKVCDALEYAHEEGVVHRDIKPENILIDKKGRVKIADFGLAKLLRREALDMTLTLAGSTLGTLRYMAPEQMDKPESVDHRADIYSLGVVIYEMLTGETPVGRFQLPSQKASVDTRLDDIVLHALERDVERRYQHASEVKTDVEKVTSKPAPAALPVPVAAEPKPASAPALHPKIETAQRMGFVRWLLRWMFSAKAGPGEWRIVVFPFLVFLGFFVAVSGMSMLFNLHIKGFDNPVLGAVFGAVGTGVLFIGLLIWRQRCLWRKYRSGEITDDPQRVAWTDIPADIRHRMILQWTVAVVALLAAAFSFMIVLNDFKTTTFVSTTNYDLVPHSKQYDLLVITPEFESFNAPGRTYHKRPVETKIGIAIHPKPGKPGADKPLTMTVKLPEMVANYWWPNVTPEQYIDGVLDIDNLSKWLSGRCGVEMNEATQKEAGQIMALLKSFREKPPASFIEFLDRMPALTTEFDNTSWGGGNGNFGMPLASKTLLPAVLIFAPLFAFALGLIRRNGWAHARARPAGLPETSRAKPRVLLRDLPPDIRSTTRVRMVVCTLIVTLFAGFVIWAAMNRLATTRHDYRITLQPKSSASYQKIELQFSFDTSEWRGVHYDVQAAKFPMTMGITLADGAKRDLQIELTGLKASYTPQRGGTERQVILDLEEFRNWLSSEAGLDVKSPDIEKQSAELASLFKRHSSSGPENIEVFQPRMMAMPSFTSSGWDSATTSMLPASLAPSITLGLIVLVFYLLTLRWIKHSAVNEAMARGVVSASVIDAAADPRLADEKRPFRWEAWWFSRSRGLQKFMDIMLISVAVLSAIAFLSGGITATTTSDHSGVTRNLYDVSIGAGDPWLYLFHHKVGTRGGMESGVNLAAGSALFGYAALFGIFASIRLSREQKRRGALADAATDTPQQKFFWNAAASVVLFVAGVAGVIVHEVRNDNNGGLLADAVHEVHPDFTRPGITSLALKKAIADELQLTPEQLEKVNASLNRAYLDFLKLENEHSSYRSENGHLVKFIKPFPDRSFELAQKLAAELRGIAGKAIIDAPERNAVWKLRLFRHAGEFDVRAELWEKDGKFHRDESWMRNGEKVMGGKSGDTLDDMKLAFGHYFVDWEAQKDIIHEPRPDDATSSHTLGSDVPVFFIERIRNGELARLMAVKDPDTVVKSGDPHAALVTQAGTSLGRACAESELRRHGITFAKEATAEELVKKLEALLGEAPTP